MSVLSTLKDLAHGITPAERKEMDKKAALEAAKRAEEQKKEKQRILYERIRTSPAANEVASDICAIVHRTLLSYNSYQYVYVIVELSYVKIFTMECGKYGSEQVYQYEFNKHGYANLDKHLKVEFISFLDQKVQEILPAGYYTEYMYDDDYRNATWLSEAEKRNGIYIKNANAQKLKSW